MGNTRKIGNVGDVTTDASGFLYYNVSTLKWALTGTAGAQGIQGIQGRQGIQGVPGQYASQGIQGIQGIQGSIDPSVLDIGTYVESSTYIRTNYVRSASLGTDFEWSAGYLEVVGGTGSSLTFNDGVDNRVLTAVNSTTFQGESNLTFNGTTLSITGNVVSSSDMTAPNFVLSSDERLKINIFPYKPVDISIGYKEFELKSAIGQKRYGVVAQDLYYLYPELVRTDPSGMMSVAYIDLLVREIAFLKYEIQKLKDFIGYGSS